jgi:hypothetical protein
MTTVQPESSSVADDRLSPPGHGETAATALEGESDGLKVEKAAELLKSTEQLLASIAPVGRNCRPEPLLAQLSLARGADIRSNLGGAPLTQQVEASDAGRMQSARNAIRENYAP